MLDKLSNEEGRSRASAKAMRRRESITLFGGAAVRWPLAAQAQPCTGTGLAFIRVCSDGSGYPALRLLCGASWVGDSPIASLERN